MKRLITEYSDNGRITNASTKTYNSAKTEDAIKQAQRTHLEKGGMLYQLLSYSAEVAGNIPIKNVTYLNLYYAILLLQ